MLAYHLFKILKKINMQLKIKQYGEQHEPRLWLFNTKSAIV
jgi:hypothetical protein